MNIVNNNKRFLTFYLFYFLMLNIVYCQDSIYQKFYFESNVVSSEGFLVNGIPEGKWISYYENKNIKSEGFWKNSLLDSTWIFYDSSGGITLKENYRNNLKNGLSIFYDSSGFKVKETKYIDGKKSGKSLIYYPGTNKIKEENNFKNGIKDGVSVEYDENQQLKTIYQFNMGVVYKKEEINRLDSEGKKQGVWREYHDNGKLKEEAFYFHGKQDGIVKKYNNKGKLEKMESFNKGKESETEISLGLELTKIPLASDKYLLGVIKENKKQGLFKVYDSIKETGKIKFFKNDTLIYEGSYDTLSNKTGLWVYYWENSQIKKTGIYIKNKKNKEWKYYYKNGELQQKGSFIRDQPEGLWEWWYENGQKRRKEEYTNGRENGVVKEFDTNGILITKGEYLFGEREGEWVYIINDYKEKGKFIGGMKTGKWKTIYTGKNQIKFQGEYINDVPIGKHIYYFPNGEIKEVGKYKDGEKEGEWRLYNNKGDLIVTYLYKRGIEIKRDGVKIK